MKAGNLHFGYISYFINVWIESTIFHCFFLNLLNDVFHYESYMGWVSQCEGVSKRFRTGRLERELQTVQLSATRCSCIAIL